MAGIFRQIRPELIGELEARPKTPKINGWGLIFYFLSAKIFLVMSATARKICLATLKRCFRLLLCALEKA